MGERKPFLLRIDSALWADLEAWAQQELRSVNAQIEYLLREAVKKRMGPKPTDPEKEKQTPGKSGRRA